MTIVWRSFILRAFFTILDYQEEDEYITLSLKSGASLHLLADTDSWHEFRLFLRGQGAPRPFRHYPRVEETVPDVSTVLGSSIRGSPIWRVAQLRANFMYMSPPGTRQLTLARPRVNRLRRSLGGRDFSVGRVMRTLQAPTQFPSPT